MLPLPLTIISPLKGPETADFAHFSQVIIGYYKWIGLAIELLAENKWILIGYYKWIFILVTMKFSLRVLWIGY